MRYLIAIVFFLTALGAFASEMQIYDLKHRSAEELIPILEPMLDNDAAITGTGYTLIVRSNRTNRAQIAQLLERLDQPPQQLLISVEQDGEQQRHLREFGLSANSKEQRIAAELHDNNSNNLGHSTQQLRVLDGYWATIRTGKAVPQVVQQYYHSSSGSRVEKHVEYRDVDSGFEVRPRVNGDQVTLDVRPFHARVTERSHLIEQQSITSTVSGRLGQWIDLGGVSESSNNTRDGIAYSGTAQTSQSHNVRLKVERIRH